MNDEVVEKLSAGREAAVAEYFSEFQSRLERMVEFRLDQRLRGRVDPADVLQEAYIEIARRIDDYISAPTVAFYVWVRQITWQTLVSVHRRHLGQKRHPNQEVRLGARRTADETAGCLDLTWTRRPREKIFDAPPHSLSDTIFLYFRPFKQHPATRGYLERVNNGWERLVEFNRTDL